MSKLKIANITEDGRWLGPQAEITKVAGRIQHDHDIETVVICPEEESERLQHRLNQTGVSCRTLSLHHLTRHVPELIRYVVFFLPEVFHLVKIIRDEDVDIVHCNGSWQIKGMIAAKITRTTAIWRLNDTETHPAVQLVFSLLAPILATAFISASQKTEDYYLGEILARRKPTWVIQAPVDTDQFDPSRTQPSEFLQQYSGVKLTTVCSVNPDKGLDVLIDATKLVEFECEQPVHFFIVGPIHESQRDYGRRLKKMVESKNLNVHFLGFRDDVPEILKASDIYVCSSRNEASPTVVWEAMSMELPIVSTDVGDVAKYLEGEVRCGYVVPTESPKELAGSLCSLVEDRRRREKFAKRAREVAISELDLDICALRHVDAYRDLLSRMR